MARSKKTSAPFATIQIAKPASNAPKYILAEAEIAFGETTGLMAGMKLTGISIRASMKEDGQIWVALPGTQSQKEDGKRRYFDHIRPVEGGRHLREAFTNAILGAYHQAAEADTAAQ
jgi:DNA-binding cell septation regulator SpoVG